MKTSMIPTRLTTAARQTINSRTRFLLAALPLALLTACAHDNLHDLQQGNESVTQQWDATPPMTSSVAQDAGNTGIGNVATTSASPELTATSADHAYDEQQPYLETEIPATVATETASTQDNEDNAMTVLVIESPEQLARLAEQQAAANLLTVSEAPSATVSSADMDSMSRPSQKVVHFAFNQTQLSDEDSSLIEQHAQYLQENPDLRIRVNGHSDAQGNPVYNQSLSEKRAKKVAEQLKKMGIEKSRIEVVGWGSQSPLLETHHHRDDRRVELEYVESQFAANH